MKNQKTPLYPARLASKVLHNNYVLSMVSAIAIMVFCIQFVNSSFVASTLSTNSSSFTFFYKPSYVVGIEAVCLKMPGTNYAPLIPRCDCPNDKCSKFPTPKCPSGSTYKFKSNTCQVITNPTPPITTPPITTPPITTPPITTPPTTTNPPSLNSNSNGGVGAKTINEVIVDVAVRESRNLPPPFQGATQACPTYQLSFSGATISQIGRCVFRLRKEDIATIDWFTDTRINGWVNAFKAKVTEYNTFKNELAALRQECEVQGKFLSRINRNTNQPNSTDEHYDASRISFNISNIYDSKTYGCYGTSANPTNPTNTTNTTNPPTPTTPTNPTNSTNSTTPTDNTGGGGGNTGGGGGGFNADPLSDKYGYIPSGFNKCVQLRVSELNSSVPLCECRTLPGQSQPTCTQRPVCTIGLYNAETNTCGAQVNSSSARAVPTETQITFANFYNGNVQVGYTIYPDGTDDCYQLLFRGQMIKDIACSNGARISGGYGFALDYVMPDGSDTVVLVSKKTGSMYTKTIKVTLDPPEPPKPPTELVIGAVELGVTAAKIQTNVNRTEQPRSFTIEIDGSIQPATISLVQNVREYSVPYTQISKATWQNANTVSTCAAVNESNCVLQEQYIRIYDATATNNTCGNGIIEASEACDRGYLNGKMLCNSTCSQNIGLSLANVGINRINYFEIQDTKTQISLTMQRARFGNTITRATEERQNCFEVSLFKDGSKMYNSTLQRHYKRNFCFNDAEFTYSTFFIDHEDSINPIPLTVWNSADEIQLCNAFNHCARPLQIEELRYIHLPQENFAPRVCEVFSSLSDRYTGSQTRVEITNSPSSNNQGYIKDINMYYNNVLSRQFKLKASGLYWYINGRLYKQSDYRQEFLNTDDFMWQYNRSCSRPIVCGDGFIEEAEVCDDGAANGSEGRCNATCTGQVPSRPRFTPSLTTSKYSYSINEESGITITLDSENLAAIKDLSFTVTLPDEFGFNGQPMSNCTTNGQVMTCSLRSFETAKSSYWLAIKRNTTPCTGQKAVIATFASSNAVSIGRASLSVSCVTDCGNNIVESGEVCDDGDQNGQPGKCNNQCSQITAGTNQIVINIQSLLNVQNGNFDFKQAMYSLARAKRYSDTPGMAKLNNAMNHDVNKDNEVTMVDVNLILNHIKDNLPECNDACKNANARANFEYSERFKEDPVGRIEDKITEQRYGTAYDLNNDMKVDNLDIDVMNAYIQGATTCGNGVQETGEQCDDGTQNGRPFKCNTDCSGISAAVCGNGVKEANEVCDDGEENGTATRCNASCTGVTVAACGNSIVEQGEKCDDGSENGKYNKCNTSCSFPVCIQDHKPRDLENLRFTAVNFSNNTTSFRGNPTANGFTPILQTITTQGAVFITAADTAQYVLLSSGDLHRYITQSGQLKNTLDHKIATFPLEYFTTPSMLLEWNGERQCSKITLSDTVASCGNGVREASEECDLGNQNGVQQSGGQTCSLACRLEYCGDGIINNGEQCDLQTSNGQPGSRCSIACLNVPIVNTQVCGNGIKEASEACDNGTSNGQPGQCNAECTGTVPTANQKLLSTFGGAVGITSAGSPNQTADHLSIVYDSLLPATHFAHRNLTAAQLELYDVNSDQRVTSEDLALIVEYLRSKQTCNSACIAQNSSQATLGWMRVLLGYIQENRYEVYRDFNLDFVLDQKDARILLGKAGIENEAEAQCIEFVSTQVANKQAYEMFTQNVRSREVVTLNPLYLNEKSIRVRYNNGSEEYFTLLPDGQLYVVQGQAVIAEGQLVAVFPIRFYENIALLVQWSGTTDICTTTTAPVCGNGIQEGTEACDDGTRNGQPLLCNTQCTGVTAPICGNGIKEANEQCDDGNQNNADACSNTCAVNQSACTAVCQSKINTLLRITSNNSFNQAYAGRVLQLTKYLATKEYYISMYDLNNDSAITTTDVELLEEFIQSN